MDANMSLTQSTFLFDDCKRFDAEHEHDRLRSLLQSDMDISLTTDPWKQHPVDFTLKNFHPDRKKNRNPLSSSFVDVLPEEKQTQTSRIHNPAVMRPFAVSYKNPINKHLRNINDDNEFVINTKIKHDYVKRILNTEQYENPKPHDFRQVMIFIIRIYYLKFFFFIQTSIQI